MSEEFQVEYSPLCRSLEQNGKSVQVDIFKGDNGGWILEVVDEFNNSTVWDDEFDSDQAALAEAQSTIKGEGIESLIGPESGSYNQ